jgi:hypothetical protein
MLRALEAYAPAADRARQMMLYGQFVGSWRGRRVAQDADGKRGELQAEVHFGWVLEGRAVQDVWIARTPTDDRVQIYGTTLRVYDPQEDCWHITWIDPLSQQTVQMIGREAGHDIVQECRDEAGRLRQWMFTGIQAKAFHWLSKEQTGDGEWTVRAEYFLARV